MAGARLLGLHLANRCNLTDLLFNDAAVNLSFSFRKSLYVADQLSSETQESLDLFIKALWVFICGMLFGLDLDV